MSNLMCHKIKVNLYHSELPDLTSYFKFRHTRNPTNCVTPARPAAKNFSSAWTCGTTSSTSTVKTLRSFLIILWNRFSSSLQLFIINHKTILCLYLIQTLPLPFRYSAGVLVEPIETTAMQKALATSQIPFALLRPLSGIPVLVRVIQAGTQHVSKQGSLIYSLFACNT